jgi:hypothetical protein
MLDIVVCGERVTHASCSISTTRRTRVHLIEHIQWRQKCKTGTLHKWQSGKYTRPHVSHESALPYTNGRLQTRR